MRRFRSIAGLMLALSILPWQADAVQRLPAGVGTRMTVFGPAFVDASGKTLYQRSLPCPDRPLVQLVNTFRNRGYEFLGKVADPATRRACATKFPPLVAPADAVAFDDWSIVTRDNGVRQWAWKGSPLHTSIKDQFPGEVNAVGPSGSRQRSLWSIAFAPLDAPPGIAWHLTTLGVVLTTYDGRALYFADAEPPRDSAASPWEPVEVPAVLDRETESFPGWSIIRRHNGQRQWAWQGRALYTYVKDRGNQLPPDSTQWVFVDVFGDPYGQPVKGWHVALLRSAPGHPEQVRLVARLSYSNDSFAFGFGDRLYTDVTGKTLYVMQCAEGTEDRLDCNDVGDSPSYWLRFCGSEEKCMRIWTPLLAPAGAQPIDGLWKVITIDPRHPWRPVADGERGLTVWAFGGQPVFTYVRDRRVDSLGDYRGVRDYDGDTINPALLMGLSQR